MTDDDFIDAILTAPAGDDTPRLAYADWLEERGDARAEFVRLAWLRLTARPLASAPAPR